MPTASHNDIYSIDPFALPYGQTGVKDYTLPFASKPFSLVWGEPRYDVAHHYDINDHTTWTAPDAYLGLRPKVAQDIEMKAFTDSNWYFQVMPIQRVNSDTVSYDTTIYKAHLARPTPALAPMRLVSSETFSNEATLISLGIAYEMDHGFLNSPKGYQHHINTLAQMANSVVEAVKFDILVTLLQAQNMKRNWAMKFGVRNQENAKRVMKDQLDFWAILQRDKRAVNIIDAEINERLQQIGGRADTYIVPPKLIDYLSIVPDETLEMDKIGPTGPSVVLDGPRPYGLMAKYQTFVARAYNISDTPEDLLSSVEEIGEYYRMLPRHISNTRGYTSRSRNIVLYDEDNDANYEVSLTEALDNSYLFDSAGNPTFPDGPHHFTGPAADLDIFKTREPDGSVQDTYFFGEMEHKYFHTSDKLQWAARAIDALARDSSVNVEQISKALQDGFTLLRRIEEIVPTKEDYARFSKDPASIESGGIGRVFAGNEAIRDPETDFLVDTTMDPLKKLIGGLQSLAGLRYLVKKNNQDGSLPREAEVARNFIDAVESLTHVLDKYAPNSAFLDPKNASSIWHYPTAATTFFENLVMPYRPPAFSTSGANQGAGTEYFNFFEDPIFTPLRGTIAGLEDFTNTAQPKLMDLFRYAMYLAAATRLKDTTKLAPVQNIFASTIANNFGSALSRSNTSAAEINHVVQQMVQNDAFKMNKAEELKTLFQSLYDAVNEAYTQYTNNAEVEFGIQDLKQRLPVLISPTVAAQLYNRSVANKQVDFWPANPNFPELPLSVAQLDAATLHLPTRIADAAAQRRARESRDPSVSPAFFAPIGQPHPMEATAFQAAATATAVGHTLEASHFATGIRLGGESSQSINDGYHAQHYDRIRAEQAGLEHLAMLDPSTRRPISPDVLRVQNIAGRMLSHSYRESWALINAEASSPLERMLAHIYDSIPINRRALDRFIQNDLIVPIGFLIARPHARYSMLTLIKCLAGSEMGSTFVQPGQFQLGDNAQVQKHFGSYKASAKAVVIHEQHVFVWRNAFANGYRGGNGTAWIHPRDYKNNSWHGQSMIAIPVPYRQNISEPLSLTGSLSFGAESFPLTADSMPQIPTAPRINALMGFRHAQKFDEYASAPHGGTEDQRPLNMICHPGRYQMYNEKEREFNIVHPGKGHWGNNTYPGCGKVRDGHMSRFEPPHFTNMIEVY